MHTMLEQPACGTVDRYERLQRACDAAKQEGPARLTALASATHGTNPSCPSVLTIYYHDLLVHTAKEVDGIIDYLSFAVRPEQRQAAIALVEPVRKHF